MSEHTPTPWRLKTIGNMGNTIEADSGKRYGDLDDGFRVVAMYQECTASDKYMDQRRNCDANGAFIVRAANNHEALVDMLREAARQLEYMQEKTPTGTSAVVLARIHHALSKLD